MYTIKQAAQRSGVSVALLRAWERRYHVIEPERTASRYRLYDDRAITRLRAMRALIGQGWSASNAAAHLLTEDDESIERLTSAPAGTEQLGTTARPADAEALVWSFADAAAAFDEPAVEAVLDEMFAQGSFEHVATNLLMPALERLGDQWSTGRLDVAAEHAAAAAVQRRLGGAFMAAGRPADGQHVVLVGLPPSARHELGALAFAAAARRAGVQVRYLGADLPVENWVDAVARTDAVAAVIGVVIESDVESARRVASALRATRPRLVIAFGGPASEVLRKRGVAGGIVLPGPLDEAVDSLREAMAAAP